MLTQQHKYLRQEDMARLKRMRFGLPTRAEGLFTGRHPSPRRGRSVEFVDYRPYMPGDELADIDWKAYARSDRMLLKRYEHQTEMSVHLLVDASASMDYPPRNHERASASPPRQNAFHKYDCACRLAASVAFLLTQQRDRFSFGIAQEGLRWFQPAAMAERNLSTALSQMEQTRCEDSAGLADALGALAGRIGRRGMVLIFSDLLDEPRPILDQLAAIAGRGVTAAVFQTLHPDELDLPAGGSAEFVDSETGARVSADPDEFRDAYRGRVHRLIDTWAAALSARGVDHRLVRTDSPPTEALDRYLIHRAAMA